MVFVAPGRIADDGRSARLSLGVTTTESQPRAVLVSVTASAGQLSSDSVQLDESGNGTLEFSCSRAEDPGCAGPVTLTARWKSLEEQRVVNVVSSLLLLPVDAGPVEPDAGFNCVAGYDGGARIGYTLSDGGPLAVGCHGEPIDAVFSDSTSPTRISICGTAEPEPDHLSLRPRAWRVDDHRHGARSLDSSWSMFGEFGGVSSNPINSPLSGTRLLLDAGSLGGIDFFVGPGKREGDP